MALNGKQEKYRKIYQVYLASERLQKMPTAWAAVELEVDQQMIQKWCNRAGLPKAPSIRDVQNDVKRQRLREDPDYGMEDKQARLSTADLADRHGFTAITISKYMKRDGIAFLRDLIIGIESQKRYLPPLGPTKREQFNAPLLRIAGKWPRPKGIDAYLESLND